MRTKHAGLVAAREGHIRVRRYGGILCNIDRCAREAKVKHMCKSHYEKSKTYDTDRKICAVDGCENNCIKKGICSRCYSQMVEKDSKQKGICLQNGCESLPITKTYRYCGYHYIYRTLTRIKRIYGVRGWEYIGMIYNQDNMCMGCGRPESLVYRKKIKLMCVDHDHETGFVRGLLCKDCNAGMGLCQDSPFLLRQLANYLERSKARELNERANR